VAAALSLLLCVYLAFISSCRGLKAGVAKVDATMPIGVPLAGYNYAPRASIWWPLPYITKYTTWMNGNVGAWNPTWVKALVIDNDGTKTCFVTLDAIGVDGTLVDMAYKYAKEMGFTVPKEATLFSASHTHSGPAAMSPSMLFAVAPSSDLLVPELQRIFAQNIAQAMVNAEQKMEDAKIDIGLGLLYNVTHNRRADISPYVDYWTIDPQVGVIALNKLDGTPLATVWNFAIHGICYDAPNMKYSSDVMGSACDWIEQNVGGVALFINGDAGDINPAFGVACNNGPNFSGGPVIGQKVKDIRASLKPSNDPTVDVQVATQTVEFGETDLNLTLARVENCTQGGPIDICGICKILDCDVNLHLGSAWIEQSPRFTAFRFNINGKQTVVVSIPGEALTGLGKQIYSDLGKSGLGFDQVLLAGYSNNYLGYFAPVEEYDIGGYESLLTMWGVKTASSVRASCKAVAEQVRAKKK